MPSAEGPNHQPQEEQEGAAQSHHLYPTVESTQEALGEDLASAEEILAANPIIPRRRPVATTTTTATATTAATTNNSNNNNANQETHPETAAVETAPNNNTSQNNDVETASVDIPQNAAIVPSVVDATDIAVVMSEQEEERHLKQRRKHALILGGSLCVALAICIIVPLLILGDNNDSDTAIVLPPDNTRTNPPTLAPSLAPTSMPSAAPTSEGFSNLLDFFIDNTAHLTSDDEEWWLDPRSAPYQAAVWISRVDNHGNTNSGVPNYGPAQTLQRFALVTLYYATGGDSEWLNCGASSDSCPGGSSYWLSEEQPNECQWGYITCDTIEDENFDVVTSIQIEGGPIGNGLTGALPVQLSLLTHLQIFAAPNNFLRGNIDAAFRNITTLRTLNLYGNDYQGPLPTHTFRNNQQALTHIYLGSNRFNSTLPLDLFSLTNVTDLHVDRNEISGSIPTEIGLLQNSSIQQIYLQHNQLRGTLPSELYTLILLEELDIHNNTRLSGTLNSSLFPQLTHLRAFSAGYTKLSGTLPEDIFIAMSHMEHWSVEHSEFQGTLSEQIALWNSTLSTLWLQYNRFIGPVPQALDSLTALQELKLEFNQFRGTISETLCAERGDGFQELSVLTVDCAFVTCGCCDGYNCE